MNINSHGLRTLNLAPSYRQGQDDIASAFYVPCVSRAVFYDRAVGFFSSSIYAIAWPGLREFLSNNGHLRLICSPYLASEDLQALQKGYEKREDSVVVAALRKEIETLFESSELEKPTEVLATLVALNLLEFRIALLPSQDSAAARRIFHDKVGILTDTNGDCVVFKGSMNETWSGLSADGNLESIDVYISWGDERELRRVRNERAFFNALWSGLWPDTRVIDFPDAVRNDLVQRSRPDDLDELINELSNRCHGNKRSSGNSTSGYIPMPHQIEALNSWEQNGRKGILHHATGSGKTVTALLAIKGALRRNEVVVIVVPSVLLLRQWQLEINKVLSSLRPNVIVCGDTQTQWKEPGLLAEWTRLGSRPRILLTTDATARSPIFLGRLRFGSHLMIVADEVHRLGSKGNRILLEKSWGSRLGLSATPNRAGDTEGTEAIRATFGDDLEPVYGILEAIKDNRLCRYFYYPHIVRLTEEEETEWRKLSQQVAAMIRDGESPEQWSPQINNLLVRRARVLKKASGKTELASKIVRKHYKPGSRWLVYCDDSNQLRDVVESLRRTVDARVLPYHIDMSGDAATTLRVFEDSGGIVVAIKCLDEGVDIPSADSALILASSKNPREFIQRRGRVLRIATGKTYANIYDAIVAPNQIDDDGKTGSMVVSEMARAIEFGQNAENPLSIEILKGQLLALGIDVPIIANKGMEDDSE